MYISVAIFLACENDWGGSARAVMEIRSSRKGKVLVIARQCRVSRFDFVTIDFFVFGRVFLLLHKVVLNTYSGMIFQ